MIRRLLASLVCAAGLTATPVLAQQSAAGNADTGAQLYFDHGCYACHGYSGFGRVDLNNTGSPWLTNEQVFRAFLRARADVAPILPATDMPNYPENALNDEMVRDIFAYIRAMPDSQPASADIPTLRTILEAAEQRQYQP